MQLSCPSRDVFFHGLQQVSAEFAMPYLNCFLRLSKETPLVKSLLTCSAATHTILGGWYARSLACTKPCIFPPRSSSSCCIPITSCRIFKSGIVCKSRLRGRHQYALACFKSADTSTPSTSMQCPPTENVEFVEE